MSPEYISARLHNNEPWKPTKAYAVAVKSFRDNDDAKKEVDNLCVVRKKLDMKSNHITLHHAILDWNSKFWIMLPMADLGNLNQLLRSESAMGIGESGIAKQTFDTRFPALTKDMLLLATALLYQCIALAEALKFLHEGFYDGERHVHLAHMDLKPDNILIFRDQGNLVGIWRLADFGISVIREVSATGSERGTMRTRAKRPQSTYQAPEIQKYFMLPSTTTIGRKSDVWSFGAMFCEVLAFAKGGSTMVAELDKTRSSDSYDTFYSTKINSMLSPQSDVFELRPDTRNWLAKLRSQSGPGTDYISCWSSAIEHILIVDPHDRHDAKTLVAIIEHIIEHAHASRKKIPCECTLDELVARGQLSSVDSSRRDSKPGTNPYAHSDEDNSHSDRSRPKKSILITQPTFDESLDSQGANRLVDSSRNQSPTSSVQTSVSSTHPGARQVVGPDSTSSTGAITPSSTSPRHSSLSGPDSTSSKEISSPSYTISNQSPPLSGDLEKISWHSSVKLPKVSAVAIGKLWIAYLTKNTIELFKIKPQKHEQNIMQGKHSVKLPCGNKENWEGIAIADNMMVTWGSSKSSSKQSPKSLVRIFANDSPAPVEH